MTSAEFVSLLTKLAEGWTKRDYEGIISRFSENVFYADAMNYAFSGRASLLAFFRDDDGLEQTCKFHHVVFDERRQLGSAEYTYDGTYRYHGTVWVEIMDGKIASWREYQHRSDKDWEEFWKNNERDRS
ncbi:MAG: nuclear transport factor 2 family protein [Acidobacteria bacterium]|nr:nuclear transport factor 2 family protein [Acidobacteriota bacterium]